MCGITGGIAQRDVAPILLEGLKRLEYRGYDSAGLAILDDKQELSRLRSCGKVQKLSDALQEKTLIGSLGIAHTRWATHGEPSEQNAHPHISGQRLALVHNGIIENHHTLKEELQSRGVVFDSSTDTEVVVHLLNDNMNKANSLLSAFWMTLERLSGAFALAVISKENPDRILVARRGSPLLIGVGIGENFIASDALALLPVVQQFVVLEEGDVAEIYRDHYQIYNENKEPVERPLKRVNLNIDAVEKGAYRHFMQKEIFEQPRAVLSAIEGRLQPTSIPDEVFGRKASSMFDATRQVQIVACGTSYHAGLVAKCWIETYAKVPCKVDIASEMRYEPQLPYPGTLYVTLSQSGETADTLAALRSIALEDNYCGTLAICNVPESSLVRSVDSAFLTHAGPEIGVASTKAFTTQLVALLMLTYCLSKRKGLKDVKAQEIVDALRVLPEHIESILTLDKSILELANSFQDKRHALFLGRGIQYPIAKEGALKLKEISYIHAEAYPAGELKHGPLALIDKDMPVVALASDDHLLDKLKSNIEEVSARKGELIVFADSKLILQPRSNLTIIPMPKVPQVLTPILYTIPLQLLAYHVAVLKGTDVDQPRNLAKSVTVE